MGSTSPPGSPVSDAPVPADATDGGTDAAVPVPEPTPISDQDLTQVAGGGHDLPELSSQYGSVDYWVPAPD